MIKRIFNFLPNIFVLSLVVVPVLIFIGYFTFKSNFFSKSSGGKTAAELAVISEEKQKYADDDNDGLLNWQEVLYKTNKDVADTDGDGISDGMEVQSGTSPTDPFNKEVSDNSEVVISNNDIGAGQASYRDNESLNKTDVVARDLFVKLTELKQANLASNPNAQKQAVEEVLRENQVIIDENYTIKDLNISNKKTTAAFKINLEKILKDYDLDSFADELVLLAQYLDTKDTQFLDKIALQVSQYKKLEKKLVAVEVPGVLEVPYLEYVNSFAIFVQIVDSFKNFKDDPVLVSSMLLLYNDIGKRLGSATQSLAFFLNEN